MNDPTDIRLIDAHSKGNRRAHDPSLVANEEFLIEFPLLRGEAGMIGQRRKSTITETRGHTIHRSPCRAIDNPAVHRPRANEVDDLLHWLILRQHTVGEIRAIETRNEHLRVFEFKMINNVLPHPFRCRCRQRHEWDIRKKRAQA